MGTRIALVLAILLGIVAALGVHQLIEQEKQALDNKNEVQHIVVASRTLKKGDILSRSVVGGKWVPKSMLIQGMISESELGLYEGREIQQNLSYGEPIFKQFLKVPVKKYQTLKSVVRDGRRAMTLRVDQISGVAGLIRTGDYVDILATYSVSAEEENAGKSPSASRGSATGQITKTIFLLQAVRVIALDGNTIGHSSRGGSSVYRTVTIEVDPWDAMRLVNAQAQAVIQLLLRSPADVTPAQANYQNRTIHWDTRMEALSTIDYLQVPRQKPEAAEENK